MPLDRIVPLCKFDERPVGCCIKVGSDKSGLSEFMQRVRTQALVPYKDVS